LALTVFYAFLISLCFFPLAKWLSFRFNILDFPASRKIHKTPVPRTGGLLLLSALFIFFSSGKWLFAFFFILIFLIGFLDDTLGLRARLRLLLQVIASISFVLITATYISDFQIFKLSSVLAMAFATFCIVGLINSYNMFDGLNGLCSGSALIFFISIFFLSYIYNYSIMLAISSFLIGSLLAFLLFNFPSGRIFLGDAGSYLIGFSIASISLIMAKEVPDISPWTFLLLSIIPIFDTVFAIYRRARQGDSPLKPDKKHLHHILRRRYKSCSKAVVHLWLIQILLSISAILFHRNYILLICLILFSVFLLRRLWYKKIEFTISPLWKALAFKPIKILLLILLVLLIPVYAHSEINLELIKKDLGAFFSEGNLVRLGIGLVLARISFHFPRKTQWD